MPTFPPGRPSGSTRFDRENSDSINGEVFNLVHRNYRISELALRVREGLRHLDIDVDICTQYSAKGIRTYRVTGRKLGQSVGFSPELDIDDAVKDMVENIRANQMGRFRQPPVLQHCVDALIGRSTRGDAIAGEHL